MQQLEIENKYSRRNVRKIVAADIDDTSPVFLQMVGAIDAYRSKIYYPAKTKRVQACTGFTYSIAMDLLTLVLPIKEISPIQAIAAQLGAQLGYNNVLDGVKTAAEIIAVCEASGAYELYHSADVDNQTGTLGIRPNYELEASTAALVSQTKYLPPMVTPPIPWNNNIHGGYIMGSGNVILGSMNQHNEYQALDVINTLQNISWSLNTMAEYIETPTKELDTHDKKSQFNLMQHESTRVYKELLDAGNAFHFVWKFDKRGRMYSQGYHCNLQGTEYKKAILSLTKKEMIQ